MDEKLVQIMHDNEQDEAHGAQWVRENMENGGVSRIWMKLQAMPDEGDLGVVARLAQMQLAKLVVAHQQGATP